MYCLDEQRRTSLGMAVSVLYSELALIRDGTSLVLEWNSSMDLQNSEMLAGNGISTNGAARVWLESVSSGMRTVEAVIRELSQNDVPVLVVAEKGSGKAAAAARIHALSHRAGEPFEVHHGHDVTKESLVTGVDQGGT